MCQSLCSSREGGETSVDATKDKVASEEYEIMVSRQFRSDVTGELQEEGEGEVFLKKRVFQGKWDARWGRRRRWESKRT